jgi:gas vesicle protein
MADVDQETSGLSKGLLLGVLTGGAVGAALALLFAPKSGRELRSDITSTTNEYVEKVSDMLSSATERAQQIVNDGRERAETIVDEARQRASTLLSDAEKVVSDARAKASGQATRIADATKAGTEAFKDELRAPSSAPNNGPSTPQSNA